MAYAIKKGSDYFNTVTYTGNGTSQDISLNFSPDLVWMKNRGSAQDNTLMDTIRGTSNFLISNWNGAETTAGDLSIGYNSDGFTITGVNARTNANSNTYVAWNWKGGESTVENTDGTITSQVSANPTSKFSVVTYTGNGSGSATIGHGLGTTPAMIIAKSRSSTQNWRVYHSSFGTTTSNTLYLDLTNATSTTDSERISAVASDTFTVTQTSGGALNASGQNYVAYCFAEVKGFSKFGSYTGNGSSNGPFVYTGFRPAFVLIKQSSVSGNSWQLLDTARETINPNDQVLFPNSTNTEGTLNATFDFLSNGLKVRTTDGTVNTNGATYIYMAFAETPFKFANAR